MLVVPLVWQLKTYEYTAARASTLTAFYTPPIVIRAMYQALENLGFQRGNLLEPSCGIGNFIGMRPESLSLSFQLFQQSNGPDIVVEACPWCSRANGVIRDVVLMPVCGRDFWMKDNGECFISVFGYARNH